MDSLCLAAGHNDAFYSDLHLQTHFWILDREEEYDKSPQAISESHTILEILVHQMQ